MPSFESIAPLVELPVLFEVEFECPSVELHDALASDAAELDTVSFGTRNLMLKVLITYGSMKAITTVSLKLLKDYFSFVKLPFFLPRRSSDLS